jgi:RNA polymerase sigma-B factor
VIVMPVQREDDRRLFRAARGGDRTARERLVELYMPLARQLARRYGAASVPLEDLEQVAFMALVKAVDGFDPGRGTAFSSYAVPCISGAIKRYFRDHSWAVRVPRGLQELAMRVQQIDAQTFAVAGRHPTAAEVAEAAGVDVEDVLEAREARRALYSDSLSQSRGSEEDDEITLLETLGDGDAELQRTVERAALDSVLAELADRERLIVQLYYREELTQAEIGRRLGYSQMHISRLIRAAVTQMQAIARDESRVHMTRAA